MTALSSMAAITRAFEIAGSAYDVYVTAAALVDECSSTTEKVVAGGLLAAGIFLPGAVYSTIGKADGVVAKKAGPTVQQNKARGDAFRDEIADQMRKEGFDIQTEVTKKLLLGGG